ncbi:MAG: hypothetical protein HY303_04120, partial [Candidatus Wallbacteria bacterium]|nr:hypothetical protein [Candidatus Wallbacteria bacterium]
MKVSVAAAIAVFPLLLAGCAGGGGGGGGSAGGQTFSKAINMQFKTPQLSSAIASIVSTPPRVEDIRTIRLQLFEGTTLDTAVQKEVSVGVPPFVGAIVVSDVTPGEHLITVTASGDNGRTIFDGQFVAKFQAGEPAFVDFIGTPVADLKAIGYAGGQLPVEPFTYILTAAGSPYRITDIIIVPSEPRALHLHPLRPDGHRAAGQRRGHLVERVSAGWNGRARHQEEQLRHPRQLVRDVSRSRARVGGQRDSSAQEQRIRWSIRNVLHHLH